MRRYSALAFGLALGACAADDLHRFADVSEGKLVVGLGMPMSEVARRSTVVLHKLPSLGSSRGSYADGNAYFDFELADSGLCFHGCSMYSLDVEGSAETVTSINVYITPDKLSWRPFTRELTQTADKLKADGWRPQPREGELGLDAFVTQDGARLGSSDSGAIAWFDWSRGAMTLRLTAHRAWNSARFYSSIGLARTDSHSSSTWKPDERWLDEFLPYASAAFVCRQHDSGSAQGRRMEIDWSMYGTADEPATVVAFYAATQTAKPDPAATTLSIAGKDARKRLAVHPVSGSYPTCNPRPGPWVKTVIVVSQATP